MIYEILHLLVEAFYRIPVITTIIILLFIIGSVIMIFFIVIIMLDHFYRPAIEQYPYNFVLDRVIPWILLLLPSFFVLTLTKDIETISYFERFNFILVTHMLILIPIFHYWSKLRSWDVLNTKGQSFITLDNPILYKQISIALIYPAICGIYFSLVRYLRLGITINVFEFFSRFNLDTLIIVVFLVPFYSIWLKLLLWKLISLRIWLWMELSKLLQVIHIYLLRYNVYFRFFENLHKIAFIWGTYVSIHPSVYSSLNQYSKFRRLLRNLYFKPYLGTLGILASICFEILITLGNIHYTLYILWIYPILYIFGYCMSFLYTMPWVNDVCRADYFARNWSNPRYPTEFWVFFADPSSETYNFTWNFSQPEAEYITKLAQKYLTRNYSYTPNLPGRIRTKPLCMRIKGAYKTHNGVRWTHTSVIRTIQSYHPITGWFLRKFEERIVLLRSDWGHYQPTLNAEKRGVYNRKS